MMDELQIINAMSAAENIRGTLERLLTYSREDATGYQERGHEALNRQLQNLIALVPDFQVEAAND